MAIMKLVYFCCVLVAIASAIDEEEDMLNLRQKKDVSEAYRRTAPDYRYSGYNNGVYDNYYNPYTKPDYYNNNNNAYNPVYNDRFYNRRNFPVEGRHGPYGAYNQQYYPAYYNSTRYQYGNYGPNPAGYNYPYNYNPYTAGRYTGYDRYNNPGYYQGGYSNNPAVYNKA